MLFILVTVEGDSDRAEVRGNPAFEGLNSFQETGIPRQPHAEQWKQQFNKRKIVDEAKRVFASAGADHAESEPLGGTPEAADGNSQAEVKASLEVNLN